jgi:hypothetical protein
MPAMRPRSTCQRAVGRLRQAASVLELVRL